MDAARYVGGPEALPHERAPRCGWGLAELLGAPAAGALALTTRGAVAGPGGAVGATVSAAVTAPVVPLAPLLPAPLTATVIAVTVTAATLPALAAAAFAGLAQILQDLGVQPGPGLLILA